eukprot:jgi/Tetstr1/459919/TSEL_005259.t1
MSPDAVPSEEVASLLEGGRAAEAASLLERCLAGAAPGDARTRAALLSELGSVKLELGDAAGAEAHFQEAMALGASTDDGAGGGSGSPVCRQPRGPFQSSGDVAANGQRQQEEEEEEEEEDDWETEWESSLSQLKISAAEPPEAAAEGKAASAALPAGKPGTSKGSGAAGKAAVSADAGDEGPPDPRSSVSSARIFNHVVEVYNLSPITSISELERFVEQFGDQRQTGAARPTVRMVDDHHALGIFATPEQAYRALAMGREAGLSIRQFSEASAASRRVPDAELQPPKLRPKTTSAVARRLLGSALGMNLRDKAADKELAERRKANKASRRQEKEAQAAVWDD